MNPISSIRLMIHRRIILFSIISILIFVSSVLSAESVDLVLLHINDTHGYLSATPDSIKQKWNYGSMPHLARVLREVQKENEGHVLTFHAGDLFSKSEPVTIQTGGGIMIDILEKLNVDLLVPGNGEYYFGIKNLIKQTEKISEKVITANIKPRDPMLPVFKSYKVIRMKGVRIGIIGLGYINPIHYASKQLLYKNPVEVAKEQSKALRDEVDLLIALTHIGHHLDKQLAKDVPEFDLIIGGHSHTIVEEPVLVPRTEGNGNVVILQAGEFWRFVGKADVHMEKINDLFKPTRITAKLIPVDETAEPDPEMNAFLQAARKPFEGIIAKVKTAYDTVAMLNLALNAVKADVSADVVILDKGVIQSELEKGPVRLGDIYRVHPWRNEILTANISGGELISMLPKIAQNKRVVMSATTPRDPAKGKKYLIDGEKINKKDTYVIAAGDYTIGQCAPIKSLAFTNTGQSIDNVLLNHFRIIGRTQ